MDGNNRIEDAAISSAHVYINGAEVFGPSDFNQNVYLLETPISLSENNTVRIELASQPDSFLTIEITQEALISINIISPVAGVTINKEEISVSGTFNSNQNEVSVIVNGRFAETYGNNFYVNHIPLGIGQNEITATIKEISGSVAQDTITIQTDTQLQPVTLLSNIESGIPPLLVRFSFDTSIPHHITSYQIDFDGDGNIDYSSDSEDPIYFTYDINGFYLASVIITDDQGGIYSGSLGINVLSLVEIDSLLRSKWAGLVNASKNKDIQAALKYMIEDRRDKYEQGFAVLVDQLPAIFSVPDELELVSITDNVAKYKDIENDEGILRAYPVTFIKDKDGFWRIMGF